MTVEGIAMAEANRNAAANKAKDEFAKAGQYNGFGDRPADHQPEDGGPLPVPPVYKSEGGKGQVSVDDMALKHFGRAIEQLLPTIKEALKDIQSIDIKAGNFQHGHKIRAVAVGSDGEGGLKKEYVTTLTRMGTAFEKLVSGINELATKYKTTEELNSKGAGDVAQLMQAFGRGMPGGGGAPAGGA
ncbi:hypothetical protein [Amycolatopsis sp. NPDC058986]|uniref:hypothetical protein n=1 Tax=unclassified Amycolatopsis TaxID=2618356 RepID=UPI00366ECB9E